MQRLGPWGCLWWLNVVAWWVKEVNQRIEVSGTGRNPIACQLRGDPSGESSLQLQLGDRDSYPSTFKGYPNPGIPTSKQGLITEQNPTPGVPTWELPS